MNFATRLTNYSLIALLVFALDRITKFLAIRTLTTPIIINKFLSLEFALNRGISGGIFHFDSTLGFVIVSSIITSILIAIIIWTWHAYQHGEKTIGQFLIIAGGFSNILDRIIYGGVIDFISVSFNSWHWALFNVADVAINIGVAILLIQSFLTKEHEQK